MSNVQNVRQNLNPVTMELGGKVRTLQFDMNAFAELENKFGSVDGAMDQLADGRIGDVRIILWTALIHEEVILDDVTGEPKGYNITPYQVGSWIKNPAMLQEVSEKLSQAMGSDMPDIDDLPEDVKQKLKDSGMELPKGQETKNV